MKNLLFMLVGAFIALMALTTYQSVQFGRMADHRDCDATVKYQQNHDTLYTRK